MLATVGYLQSNLVVSAECIIGGERVSIR